MFGFVRPGPGLGAALQCLLAFALAAAAVAQEAPAPEPYTVVVEGRKHSFVFLLRVGERLAASAQDLELWGIEESRGASAEVPGVALEVFWLDDLEGFDVEVDGDAMQINLKRQIEQGGEVRASPRPAIDTARLERAWGADVTYRASALTRPDGSPLLQLRTNWGASLGDFGRLQARLDFDRVSGTDAGSASFSETARHGGWSGQLRSARFERDFRSGYLLRFGQLENQRGGVATGLRLLGASWGTNVLGRARVSLSNGFGSFEDVTVLQEPATLEVRVNGRLVASQAVGVGRLSIADVPLDVGANDVEILLLYADGRVESFDRRLVAGAELITAGATEFGASVGLLDRSGFAERRADYDAPYGAFSVSRGLSEDHTLHFASETRGGDEELRAARVEWVGRLPGSLIARAAAAWSDAEVPEGSEVLTPGRRGEAATASFDASGGHLQVSLEHASRRSSLLLGLAFSQEGYLTLRQVGFATEPRFEGRAGWQFALGRRAQLGVDLRVEESVELGTAESMALTLRAPLGPLFVNARVAYDERASDRGLVLSTGVTVPLGRGNRLTTSSRSRSGAHQGSVRYGRSLAANATGLAWSAQIQQTETEGAAPQTRGAVMGLARNRRVELRADLRRLSDGWAVGGELAGSLVLAGGRVYATRPVGPSFVLVDAQAGEDVKVLENRRSVGRTGSRGRLLLPFVQSYTALDIGLDPASLEPWMLAPRTERTLAPAPGFSRVELAVRRSLQARAVLVDGQGHPWPAGSEVRTLSGDRSGELRGVVGKRGVAYLVDLEPEETLLLIAGKMHCELALALVPELHGVLDLGELRCEAADGER